jgi:hypothetical protein
VGVLRVQLHPLPAYRRIALVAYLDGHVESIVFDDRVPDPAFCSPEFVAARREHRLGFVSGDNAVYTGE